MSRGAPDPKNWTLPYDGGMLSYCMAENAQEHCRIQFSMSLMVAVIVCNIIKVMCMGIIVWKLDPKPLFTIGDAIATFLDSPGGYIVFLEFITPLRRNDTILLTASEVLYHMSEC